MTAVATFGHNSMSAWRAHQPGVSDAASFIGQIVQGAISGFAASATGQQRLGDPLSAIDAIYSECQLPNWDGENAVPISAAACREAKELLFLLPTSVSIPEFLPEPSGRIAFEWYKSPHVVYVLSVCGAGEIEFAGIFGRGNELFGRCAFRDAVPSLVVDHLREFQRQ